MEELQEAVISGNIDHLSALLCSSQHLINAPIDEADTTLIHLAANSTPKVIQVLLRHGANIDCQEGEGLTALHVAAMWGKDASVKTLLEEGAQPLIEDDEHLTPADHAINQGHTECAVLLQMNSHNDTEMNMSMAETFADMYSYELTEVTQLELDSSLTQLELDSPLTPTPTTPSILTSPTTPSILTSPTTPTTPTSHSELPDLLYTESREKSVLTGSPLLEDSVGIKVSASIKNNPRRELFPPAANTVDTITKDVAKLMNETFTKDSPPVHKRSNSSYTNQELREKLISLGEQPGPVNDSTRSAYLSYLEKIQAGIQPTGNKGYKGYKYELSLVLNGTVAIPKLDNLEHQLFRTSLVPSSSVSSTPSTPQKKDHFNYLLLNPLIMDKLEEKSTELERFQVFVEGVFYVGKGKNSRSMQHMKDAKKAHHTPSKISAKLQTILDIWSGSRGVISLQLFHNTTGVEAYTREACLIEAIGLEILTNIQHGHVYGDVRGWLTSKRRLFGVHLLYKAFQIYSIFKPKEIFQEDL